MKLRNTCLLLATLITLGFFPVQAATAMKPVLTLDLAKKIAAKANAEAAKNNWSVVIAIFDDGANLLYLERMDGTQLGSIEIAQKKASTAIKFKRPSKVFEDNVIAGQNKYLVLPGAAPLGGGLPLVVDGHFIGAIGVSGMTSAQDGVVAAAGVSAL